ncbi:MAG TPA: CDP-alcohol phosphatidyltransferase family protein [Thermoplasmata archaeon]|nr:CDP-alcohol phosphatidyltransferase family protein [Thermoplasmata archaeon]HEV2428237.1 CDP-alcohol phosphatidyltransferase family protein [Thermoplasmata archaeon]
MRPGNRWPANLSTLANGLVGVGAIAYVLAGNKLWAMMLIVSGIGFDGLDGWLSRRAGLGPSKFGRIADSVADAVTFGLAPAALLIVHTDQAGLWQPWNGWTELAGATVAALALGRLAWFTVRSFRETDFVGVPTPQNALALVALLLWLDVPGFAGIAPEAVAIGAIGLAVLMVVPIRFPKIRRGSALRYPMTGTGVAFVVALLPLQFRPAPGTVLDEIGLAGTAVATVGVAAYYLLGPFTVHGPPGAPEGEVR